MVCALAFAFSTAHIQRAALHSAHRYTAPSATQRPALHTARSIAQRPALHCTKHSEPRQGRSQRASQAYTARSATQCPALHSAQRFTAPSASLCPAQHCAHTAPRALHSAQHYPTPSITLHRAQRAKTRPNAATEPPLAQRGFLRFLCSISAHENRSADTRARSLCLKRLSSKIGRASCRERV